MLRGTGRWGGRRYRGGRGGGARRSADGMGDVGSVVVRVSFCILDGTDAHAFL